MMNDLARIELESRAEPFAQAVEERRPGLGQVIAGCLVGWNIQMPRILWQGLMVKIDEYMTKVETEREMSDDQ